MKMKMMVGSQSDDGNNDQVPGDPQDGPHRPRRPRGCHGPMGFQIPMGSVAPIFMNLLVKCPIFSAKGDEDAGSHLLHSNDWMSSQGIAEEIKCDRFS